jgi:hypothetical protein
VDVGRKILVGCGVLVLAAVVAAGALLYSIGARNSRAVADARAFCAVVRPGASLAWVQEAGRRHRSRPMVQGYGDRHEVRFPGVMLFSAVCYQTVADGKVTATDFAIED